MNGDWSFVSLLLKHFDHHLLFVRNTGRFVGIITINSPRVTRWKSRGKPPDLHIAGWEEQGFAFWLILFYWDHVLLNLTEVVWVTYNLNPLTLTSTREKPPRQVEVTWAIVHKMQLSRRGIASDLSKVEGCEHGNWFHMDYLHHFRAQYRTLKWFIQTNVGHKLFLINVKHVSKIWQTAAKESETTKTTDAILA